MKLTISFALLLIGCVAAENQKLPIQLYYGPLCPDSIRFVQNQFYPLYSDFKDYVDILYVPFGKASSTTDDEGNITFRCQQGPHECDTARAQLCALKLAENYPDIKASFVGCQMAFGADQTGETCANRVGIPFASISECVYGPQSTQLMLDAEAQTNTFALTWVPTTIFNWEFNQDLTTRAEFDLKNVICEQLNNAAPACQQ